MSIHFGFAYLGQLLTFADLTGAKMEDLVDELVCRQLNGLAGNPSLPFESALHLLNHDDHQVRFGLLWREGVPDNLWQAAVSHPDPKVRGLIGDNWHAPAAWRARLAGDPDVKIRRAVAAGPHPFRMQVPPLPAEIYAQLANDPDTTVREEIAGLRQTPLEVRVALAADPEPRVRATTCRFWLDLPDETVDRLLEDEEPAVRRAAAQRAYHRRPELIAVLLEDDGFDMATLFHRSQVAENAALDRATAHMLATHTDHGLRQAVAANPSLPAELVALLAGDESPHVRLVISMRQDLTEEQRAAIDYEVKPHDRLSPPQWVLDNLDNLDLMRSCVQSRHLGLRRSSAYSPHLPADLVEILAKDNDFAVRLLLCENHPDVPGGLLLDTFLKARVITRFDLIARPNFPRHQLAHLADSASPEERRLAILDASTSGAVIEQLSHDPDPHVRAGAAADPRLSIDRLMQLLDQPDTASAAAANPQLPHAAMATILTRSGISTP